MLQEEEPEGSIEARAMSVDCTPLLEDLVGTAKEFADDFSLYSSNTGIFSSMGVNAPSTFLLEGEPGTGKTMAIHALNNSYNKSVFIKSLKGEPLKGADFNLMVFEYSIGRHGTAYINRGSRTVQTFFDKVGAIAKYGMPVLVFLDEADALLPDRNGNIQGHSEDRKVLETIMKNLQIAHDTRGMNVVLASNTANQCDEASLRAGRIDKKYHFELPNQDERALAYTHFIEKANARAGYKVVRGSTPSILAEMSEGFNYADIKQSIDLGIIKRATELSQNRVQGIIPAGYINQKRLEYSVKDHAQRFKKKPQKATIGF